jgi:beta-lactamase regulating signal transducer with metallopeptidase domain
MWTYTLLLQILNMSLTAGIVIVLVLLARLPLKKAPKVFSYALWAVVLFRLVCPVSFSSQFSLIGLFHASSANSGIRYIPTDIVHAIFPQASLPLPGVGELINSLLPQGAGQLAAEQPVWPAAATLLWLSGVAAMLLYSAASLTRLRRKLVGAVCLRGNIYLADHIASPFVIGILRPRIYLPSTLPEEERGYVIAHEQTHIRRLDHIVKLLAFLALAVHWFNPLVWAAFICAVQDMEMSCDERVLKQMGGGSGARTGVASRLATGRRILSGSPLAFSEGNIKGRIKNVMNFKKPAAWIIVVLVLLVVALSIGLAANTSGGEKDLTDKSFTLVAWVDETLSETEAAALQDDIEHNRNVESAVFETREEAFENYNYMDKFADKSLFEGLDSSILRHRYYIYSYDITLAEQTAKEIADIAGIAKVIVAEYRVETVYD